ncbi:MAG: carbohydrate kinase family protein [Candidatus Diapherotrites archaeon]|nr:carbohydrate kinase family protein [Candidatus Diapherotrites archaeon]
MYDVICIGNATQDVFVKISKEYANKDICFIPGQKIEIEGVSYHTGGGASNCAVSFSRLGLKTAVVCALGNDPAAKAIVDEFETEKVATSLIIKSNTNTAYSVILTGFGRDRVILTYKGATASIEEKNIPWEKLKAKWLYVSSLHKDYRITEKICSFAKEKKMNVALNPGKIELSYGLKNLEKTFRNTDILFLNESEALSITGKANIERNLIELQKYSKIVVITAGAYGAYSYDGRYIYYKNVLPVNVVDSTGCGDAFNSAFTAALIYGKTIEDAMCWGTAQSNSVITEIGTKNILLHKNQIEKFLSKFENGFEVEKREVKLEE